MNVRFRHKIVYALLRPLGRLIFRIKYGFKGIKVKEKGPFFILSNHTSMLDPVMLAFSFRGPIYYVASDDIFSIPFWSKLLIYLVSPIPKTKGASDLLTIKAMINVARKGHHVAIYPSGNTTYSGCEEHIPSQIGRLAKKMKLPIAIYNTFGLYGVDPRWARAIRKGNAFGKVVRIMPYEEYKDMSDEELDKQIVEGLSTNAFLPSTNRYQSKHRAEYIERVMFLCPDCNKFATLVSKEENVHCTHCGYHFEYGEDLQFHYHKGDRQFKNIKEYYDYLKITMQLYDFSTYDENTPIFFDQEEKLIFNERAKKKTVLLENADVYFYINRVVIKNEEKEMVFPLTEIKTFAVQNRSKILFYTDRAMYQLKGKMPRSALKYLFTFYSIHKVVQKDGTYFMGI